MTKNKKHLKRKNNIIYIVKENKKKNLIDIDLLN